MQFWVQKHPDDYISCSILDSSDLGSYELTTQQIASQTKKDLSKSEQVVNSNKKLISVLRKILQKRKA